MDTTVNDPIKKLEMLRDDIRTELKLYRREVKELTDVVIDLYEQAHGKKLVDINEAMEILGCSRRTIYRKIDRGELTAYNRAGLPKGSEDQTQNFFDYRELTHSHR